MSSIEIFQETDGRWRWQYRDAKVDLKSNRTYPDGGAAMHAARTAYPQQFETPASPTDGLVLRVAKLLAVILVIAVWRRRSAPPRGA